MMMNQNPKELKILVKSSGMSKKKELLMLVSTFDRSTGKAIEVTARTANELEALSVCILSRYGGFVIPVFYRDSAHFPETTEVYLNELVNCQHCNSDPNLKEFLFEQSINLAQPQAYDLVLTEAAAYSRRHLNKIFTRSSEKLIQTPLNAIYTRFLVFAESLNSLDSLFKNAVRQQECLEETMGLMTEVVGGTMKAVYPGQYVSAAMTRQVNRLQALIRQAREAYERWRVLNETVRELQCEAFKGMHEDTPLQMRQQQLKLWTKSLCFQFQHIIKAGQDLMKKLCSQYILARKQHSMAEGQEK